MVTPSLRRIYFRDLRWEPWEREADLSVSVAVVPSGTCLGDPLSLHSVRGWGDQSLPCAHSRPSISLGTHSVTPDVWAYNYRHEMLTEWGTDNDAEPVSRVRW